MERVNFGIVNPLGVKISTCRTVFRSLWCPEYRRSRALLSEGVENGKKWEEPRALDSIVVLTCCRVEDKNPLAPLLIFELLPYKEQKWYESQSFFQFNRRREHSDVNFISAENEQRLEAGKPPSTVKDLAHFFLKELENGKKWEEPRALDSIVVLTCCRVENN
ncbi:unnamed protein product, partial [Cyprideis torosa]